MAQQPYAALIDLVIFDQGIYKLQENIDGLERVVEQLHSDIRKCSQEIDEDKLHVIQLRKYVDNAELEMKALDTQELEKKQKLENVKDNKEYQALKSEIDRLKRAQVEQEQKVVATWNTLETAQKNHKEKIESYTKKIDLLKKEVEEKKIEIVAKKEFISSQLTKRAEYIKNVPEEWLTKYESMKTRVQDPVVEVVADSCSACASILTLADLQKIKRGELVQCKFCYRLLYNPDILSH